MLGYVLIYYVHFDEFFLFYATFNLGNFCKLQKKGRTDQKVLRGSERQIFQGCLLLAN